MFLYAVACLYISTFLVCVYAAVFALCACVLLYVFFMCVCALYIFTVYNCTFAFFSFYMLLILCICSLCIDSLCIFTFFLLLYICIVCIYVVVCLFCYVFFDGERPRFHIWCYPQQPGRPDTLPLSAGPINCTPFHCYRRERICWRRTILHRACLSSAHAQC